MSEAADDQELLRRSAAGDRSAFDQFMQRHVAAVYRLLLSLTASPDEAEDAVQDCFLGAWRSAASYHGPGSARAWLFAIARNALRRQHRRHVAEPAAFLPLEVLGERAGWGTASDFSAELDARDTLERALAQLAPEEREIIALRDLAGYTGHETAEALGLTLAAMKSRLHRSRLHLMGVLRAVKVENA